MQQLYSKEENALLVSLNMITVVYCYGLGSFNLTNNRIKK